MIKNPFAPYKKKEQNDVDKLKKANNQQEQPKVDYTQEIGDIPTQSKLEQRVSNTVNGQDINQIPQGQGQVMLPSGQVLQQDPTTGEIIDTRSNDQKAFTTGRFARYDKNGKLIGYANTPNAGDPRPIFDKQGDFVRYADGRYSNTEGSSRFEGSSSSISSSGSSGGSSGGVTGYRSDGTPILSGDRTDPDSEITQVNALRNQGLAEGKQALNYLGVDSDGMYNSKDQIYRDKLEMLEKSTGVELARLDLLEEEELLALEQMTQQVEGAIGANRASFSQSREGVQAGSLNMVKREFEEHINKQLNLRVKQSAQLMTEIALKKEQLELAKKEGQTGIAESLAMEISRAKDALQENKMEYIDALGRQIDQQLKVDQNFRAQFDTAYSMMASGQEFSTDQLMGLSNSLGLPSDLMLSTYSSLQRVRNDKGLSEEQKIAETQNIILDSQMRANGFMTEKQQSAKMLIDRYQAGAISKEFLETQMTALDINDPRYNPFARLELEQEQLSVEMERKKLNGEPITFQDRIAMADFQLEQMALNGELMGYEPTESLEGISATYQNGELVFDLTNMQDRHWECGEFVNRTWGLPSGAGGGFPDLYSDKKAMIDIPADSVDEFNIIQTVRPGMAFVMGASGDAAKYGHVGIVSKVYPDGTFDTVEANFPGDKVKANVVNKRRSIADVDGFTKPPAGKVQTVGGGVAKMNNMVQSATPALTQLVSKDEKGTVASEIQRLAESGDPKRLQDYVKTTVFNSLTADQSNKLWLRSNIVGKDAELKKLLEQYQGDMGIFEGSLIEMKNKIGKMADPEQQKIAQLIRLNLEDFGRAQTGAAIQDFENDKFKDILPDIYDGKELAIAKIESFAEAVEIDVNSTLRFKLGDSVYNDVFGVNEVEPEEDWSTLYETALDDELQSSYQSEMSNSIDDEWDTF
jgi:hypothetical protein